MLSATNGYRLLKNAHLTESNEGNEDLYANCTNSLSAEWTTDYGATDHGRQIFEQQETPRHEGMAVAKSEKREGGKAENGEEAI